MKRGWPEGEGKSRHPLPMGRVEGGMLKFPPRVRKRKKEKKRRGLMIIRPLMVHIFGGQISRRDQSATAFCELILAGVEWSMSLERV